jgi:hypothetical protein
MTGSSDDDAILDALELTSQLVAARTLLSDLLAQGHLNLAQSKFILGAGAVTSLQYNLSDMRTSRLIDGCIDRVDGVDENCDWKLRAVEPASIDDAEETTTAITTIGKTADALRWFSVLPPTALRNAQSHFARGTLTFLLFIQSAALEAAVTVAQLQHRLEKALQTCQ